MSFMFQPQACRFMLYTPFYKIINNHLQGLQFDPINGVQLTFERSIDKYREVVTVEIDPEGNISRVSVIDPEVSTAEIIFDFSHDEFIHYGEPLDLICGHPLFHMLQQTFATKYQDGCYSVEVKAL